MYSEKQEEEFTFSCFLILWYRIIDNYEDFSKLTQRGQKIDESMFDGYFVLVLRTYKNQYVYYSYLEAKGEYVDFRFDTSSNDLKSQIIVLE